MEEFSELQGVDFGLGAFIAGAFAGYADAGPANWREFLKRPVGKQVIRHDADSPQGFVQDYLKSQEGETVSASGARDNRAKLPVAYYFRKPGYVNTQDQKGSAGIVEVDGKKLKLYQRPLSMDYTIVFLAFDKPTLDKLCLAWYRWSYAKANFPYPTIIGDNTLQLRCAVQDHTNLMLANASFVESGARYYAVSANYTVCTNVLFGGETTTPTQRLIYGFARENEERYVVTPEGLSYLFDSATRAEGRAPFLPGSVSLWDGAALIATDDGHGSIESGTVDYYNGTVAFNLSEAPEGVVSVSFVPLQGRTELI